MRVIMEALGAQHGELDATLSGLDRAGWERPSRCPGWTVGDVVLHLAQTDELVVTNASGDLGPARDGGWDVGTAGPADPDTSAGAAVERERGADGPALLRRWRAASSSVREMLAASDPRRPIPWVVGSLPARTMATTRLAECWIHTGDVLHGLGRPQQPTDRLWHIARLAWRTLPYAFAKAGRQPSGGFGLELTAPDGSTWAFGLDDAPDTVLRGDAAGFCLVAAQRTTPEEAGLSASGPDAAEALALVRTFA